MKRRNNMIAYYVLTLIIAGAILVYSKEIVRLAHQAAAHYNYRVYAAVIQCAPLLFILLMTIRSKFYLSFLEKKSDLIPEIIVLVLMVILIVWPTLTGGVIPLGKEYFSFLANGMTAVPGIITGIALADCVLGIQKLRKKKDSGPEV